MPEGILWMYQGQVRSLARDQFLMVAFVYAKDRTVAQASVEHLLAQDCLREIERIGIEEPASDQEYRGLEARRALEEAEKGQVGYYLFPL